MRNFIKILLLAAVTISAASCIRDEHVAPGQKTVDRTDVRLRLRTPGSFTSSETRALTYAEENTIDNVYVLVFDNDDNLAEIKKGEGVTDNTGSMTSPSGIYSGGGEFSVTLPPSTGTGAKSKSKLVVLANAENILDDCGLIDISDLEKPSPYKGDDYDDVIADILDGITGAMYTSGGTIPMWGETAKITIDPNTAPEITLMRAVVRIDVGLGDAAIYEIGQPAPFSWDGLDATDKRIPFQLQSVNIVRANDTYTLIPDPDYLTIEDSKPSVNAPTLAESSAKFAATEAEAAKFRYAVSGGLFSTQSIYVPEADIKIGGTKSSDANHTNRMAVIVGGVYDANKNNVYTDAGEVKSYYRLDFAHDGNLIDVLRNHLYRFNIQGVSGNGYPSVIEAYESYETNMTAEIIAWNEGGTGNEGFDGPYHFHLTPDEFTFEGVGGMQPLSLDTDYPTWTAKASTNRDGTGVCDWLKFDNGLDNNEGTGSASAQNIAINAARNDTGAERTAWITVKAGERLAVKVKVTQERFIDPGVLAAPGVIGYIKGTNTLTLKGSKEYASNAEIAAYAQAEFGGLSTETVYVAYFKWGSLVAIASEYASTTFSPGDIVAAPKDFAGANGSASTALAMIRERSKGGATGNNTGQTAWGTYANQFIPYRDGTDAQTNEWLSEPAKGLGDPCEYYTDEFGSGWRLPTTTNANPYGWQLPDGSFPFGTTTSRHSSTSYSGGADWKDANEVGIGIPAGAVGGDGGTADWSMFLPAAGYRMTSGSVSNQGSAGYYWSSTATTDLYGYGPAFGSSEVSPANTSNYATGFVVRCVKGSPTPPAPEVPESVQIGDDIWATRNVGTFGEFVEKETDSGMLYQFGSAAIPEASKVAWPGLDNPAVVGPSNQGIKWNNGASVSAFNYGQWNTVGGWTAANNPCPTGWTVPTRQQWQALLDNTDDTSSGNGRKFTSKDGSGNYIFMPLTGFRSESTGTMYSQNKGYYWSSTNYYDYETQSGLGYNMIFSATEAAAPNYYLEGNPHAIRCVQGPPPPPVTYSVTAAAGANGSAAVRNAGGQSITEAPAGEQVTFTATPNANYVFTGWTGTGYTPSTTEAKASSLTITMPAANVTLTATFKPVTEQRIFTTSEAINLTESGYYYFEAWGGDGGNGGASEGSNSAPGGIGAKSVKKTALFRFDAGNVLYVQVGTAGANGTSAVDGGDGQPGGAGGVGTWFGSGGNGGNGGAKSVFVLTYTGGAGGGAGGAASGVLLNSTLNAIFSASGAAGGGAAGAATAGGNANSEERSYYLNLGEPGGNGDDGSGTIRGSGGGGGGGGGENVSTGGGGGYAGTGGKRTLSAGAGSGGYAGVSSSRNTVPTPSWMAGLINETTSRPAGRRDGYVVMTLIRE